MFETIYFLFDQNGGIMVIEEAFNSVDPSLNPLANLIRVFLAGPSQVYLIR